MAQISTGDVRSGAQVEVDGEPYTVVGNEFVKPGKGQPFNRIKLKHLKTGRVVEKTFKSGEKLNIADVEHVKMRLLYRQQDDFVFMDEKTYNQYNVSDTLIGDKAPYCKDDTEYELIFYKGEIIEVVPPTFMEMTIVETAPGLRGDTSGRVLKPALTDTGAKVQVPIFCNEGDKIKVDTRTGEYVSRL